MSTHLVGNTHIIAGNAEILPQLLAFLEGEGIKISGNPDIYVHEYKYFSVDDARALRDRASLRPVRASASPTEALAKVGRVFVIAAPDMNHNAQNALLKILEEPHADAMFFFIVPAPEMLLATFRSRAQILVLARTEQGEHAVDAKAFLAAAPQKRLDMLKPLLEKDEDDKRDIGSILTFLSSLERTIAGLVPSAGKRDALEALYRARKYMGDKGALVKPLLEQVALLVPKV